MPNRLAASTSPSLRQHAENPVDRRDWSAVRTSSVHRQAVPDGCTSWSALVALESRWHRDDDGV